MENDREIDRHLKTKAAESIRKKIARVFESLDSKAFIKPEEMAEFRYYESLFAGFAADIDRKIAERKLVPLDFRGFPQTISFPGYAIRAGFYIGSFDPFQMTHLSVALKVLASADSAVDVVFVIPEGHKNPAKPNKSEYRYRFDVLKMQVKNEFSPLIVPLDLGENADTIKIISRFIELVPGAKIEATHIIGSDILPFAVRLLPIDLEEWGKAADKNKVRFSYKMFVIKREADEEISSHIEKVEKMGIKTSVDWVRLGTPSSTDFREKNAFTILFPTDAILSHVEVLFRYGMARTWSDRGDDLPPIDYII